MAKLSRVLYRLERKRLPVHVTPVAKQMIDSIANALSAPLGPAVRQLTNPALADGILDMVGEPARVFDPILHNTASPTMLKGGEKLNVHPSEIVLDLDGRLLPGFGPEVMVRELQTILGRLADVEVVVYDPGPPEPNMALFETLSKVLKESDPDGIPIPYMLSGVTDGRHFAKLGIQTYGFLPMRLPPDFKFAQTVHAADERIPTEALDFGTEAIYNALQRFHA
jgi:acetylornithine deacetylase/succinyl-diaminopimelate desuccinylase-like protein